jgi:hypothetical protein
LQDESSKSFKITSIFGQELSADPVAPLQLLLGAKTHPASGSACEKGLYPPDFTTCPYCGSKLLEPTDHGSGAWIPPYGTGNGVKLYQVNPSSDRTNAAITDNGSAFHLPSRDGRFAFFSIMFDAQQRLLVALQRDNGRLWVYRPGDEKKWQALNGYCGGDALPAWSWSLAVNSSETGLCIPTDQGPVFVNVNWTSGTIQTDRAKGKSIGGAIRLADYLLAPVLCDENVAIVFRKETDSTWSECPSTSDSASVVAQLRRRPDQVPCFGIPFLDESKQIVYWPCRGGYIRAFGAESSSGLTWEFRPWETDAHPATALIELGPPYRKTGSRPGFWQLCEDRDTTVRDGIVNKIIKVDGDEHIDSEVVECGQFLTTGRAGFSWSDDYWDDIHKRNPRIGEQKELRIPLLQFGEKGLVLIAKVAPWEGRDELGVFSDIFFNRTLKTTTFVRFVLEGSGIPERALYAEGVDGVQGGTEGSLFRVSIAHVPELAAFIYAGSLHVYFPENNDCYRWPLELMEG